MELDGRLLDLDLSSEGTFSDFSGTPIFLLDQARRHGDLTFLQSVDSDQVLIDFPFDEHWRRQLGCTRFVRLRQPREGKKYALVVEEQAPGRTRRRRRRSRRPRQRGRHAPSEIPMIPYEGIDPVGGRLGLDGAGIMAYLTGDHMHPPMVDDELLWSDSRRWPEAAAAHSRAAARLLAPAAGERVLDVGCGVGGPARLLVEEFGCGVHGIANAGLMLETAARINSQRALWEQGISLAWHDCQKPFLEAGFDAAWSMNMIYRVPDQAAMLRNIADALRPGGRLMIEDWMYTDRVTGAEREQMARHFHGAGIVSLPDFPSLLQECGFSIVADEDLGEVGRTHLARYFIPLFDRYVRPRLEADFPDPASSGTISGEDMADQWVEGIELTTKLYGSESMTYMRCVAVLDRSSQESGGRRS
jgi:SAM-dependent methyltransferase